MSASIPHPSHAVELPHGAGRMGVAIPERGQLEAVEFRPSAFTGRFVASNQFPDASEFQGSIDFKRLRAAGHQILAARVQDGSHLDQFWGAARVSAAFAESVVLFPYAYARVAAPNNGWRSAGDEIRLVQERLRRARFGHAPAYQGPLIYDFESTNGQSYRAAGLHYVSALKIYNAIHGFPFVTYTMPGFWNAVWAATRPALSAAEQRLVASSPLHAASWGVRLDHPFAPFSELLFHQFTDNTRYAGVAGRVDGNYRKTSMRHVRRRHTLRALA